VPWAVLALALFVGDAMAADMLAEAATRFQALQTYRVTLRSHPAEGEAQVIRYAWRRPGWIRMDFVEPHHGAMLIYDPGAHRVRLSPFGPDTPPSFNLAPDNRLILSPRGHRVDQSDVGALLANLEELRTRGRLSDPADGELGGRAVKVVEIEGNPGVSVLGVHRYRVWFARDSLFPLKVQSFDANGTLMETVDMSDAELDVAFPERFFAP
jgi:outer membrane lipoprotein-sorting protein